MKRLLTLVLILLSVFSITALASEDIMIGTPTVDGLLDSIYLDSYKIDVSGKSDTFHTSRGGTPTGSHGDSATAYFLYDNEYLYACIKVSDDKVYSRGAAWIKRNIKALSWENDAVELRLYYTELGEKIKANQYIFQADACSVATTNYKSMCPDPYTVATSVTDDGFIVEFGIKLSFDTKSGEKIGLSIEIDDLHEEITSPTSPMGAHDFNAYGSQAPYDNMVALGDSIAKTPELLPNDIKAHWARDYISYVLDVSLFNGTDRGFEPDTSMTRAMFVTVLGRAYEMKKGTLTVPEGSSAFSDVDLSSWYAKYVIWASENGIVKGYNGKFSPNASITREEMAVMIHRFLNLFVKDSNTSDNSYFTDGDKISSWAKSSVEFCYEKGYLLGDSNKEFKPQNTATRAEVATTMMRLLRSLTVKQY